MRRPREPMRKGPRVMEEGSGVGVAEGGGGGL